MNCNLYGSLPNDCWQVIGKRCTIFSLFKIASTCTKLRDKFFQHISMKKCMKIIKKVQYNKGKGLFRAASLGHWNLVNYFVSKGADLNDGLDGAAKGGHRDLVDIFISKGADDWNTGLLCAAECNADDTVRRDLVDLFMLKGADLNWGLEGAARSGHRDLVDLFISKGADNWNHGFAAAADGGHRDLIELFISKGAKDIKWALECAEYNTPLYEFIDFKFNEFNASVK